MQTSELSCSIIQDDERLEQEQPRSAGSTWLPYTLIDQVLLAAESQDGLSSRGQALRAELLDVIASHTKHAEKLTAQIKQAA